MQVQVVGVERKIKLNMSSVIVGLILSALALPAVAKDWAELQEKFTAAYEQNKSSCAKVLSDKEKNGIALTAEDRIVFTRCLSNVMNVTISTDKNGIDKMNSFSYVFEASNPDIHVTFALLCDAQSKKIIISTDKYEVSTDAKLMDKGLFRYKIGDFAPKKDLWRLLQGKAIGVDGDDAESLIRDLHDAPNHDIIFEIGTDRSFVAEMAFKNLPEVKQAMDLICR
ncbi:hypothetical protein G3A39_39410 [Paraburkholderia aspalathi]|nr:hypothetical protein [Paraburkholderia aspalathi]